MDPPAQADPYQLFRSWVAQQKVSLGNVNEKIWKYYDFGPKDEVPLVCIPGTGGTAEVFYRQMISLCPKGYRIVSVQYAAYDTHQGWCKGFDRFLDKINAPKVHLFGTSLGGYLAQCYAQYRPARVLSLILNNTFSDTQYFHDNSPCAAMFSLMPEFMLKRIILENFPVQKLETEIANSVDFMVEQLEALSQAELASRLTLNCALGFLRPGEVTVPPENITIIDTFDDNALPENVREEVYKFYPDARVAHMKTGGNFPYLSRPDEVNMHIQVHLRKVAEARAADTTTTTTAAAAPAAATTTTDSSSSSSSSSNNNNNNNKTNNSTSVIHTNGAATPDITNSSSSSSKSSVKDPPETFLQEQQEEEEHKPKEGVEQSKNIEEAIFG